MIQFVLFFIFLVLDIYIVYNTRVPENLRVVKEKYQRLREHIKNNNVDDKFKVLEDEILISGFFKNNGSGVGYNTNKGYEIGICLDGDPNEIFHVLLHELAHSMSSAYSHDAEFWQNFDELKSLCEKQKIYTPISNKTEFCGRYIQDQ